MDAYLRHAVSSPKADPMPLVPLMAQATKGLGVIATAFYPPYLGRGLRRPTTTLAVDVPASTS